MTCEEVFHGFFTLGEPAPPELPASLPFQGRWREAPEGFVHRLWWEGAEWDKVYRRDRHVGWQLDVGNQTQIQNLALGVIVIVGFFFDGKKDRFCLGSDLDDHRANSVSARLVFIEIAGFNNLRREL